MGTISTKKQKHAQSGQSSPHSLNETTNIYFVIPGDLEAASGGYAYDRHILKGLRQLGWNVYHIPLTGAFPLCSAQTRHKANAKLTDLPDNALVLVDGLAYGALPEVISIHAKRLNFITLVHHPLFLEAGLGEKEQKALHSAEKLALQHAQFLITTSDETRKTVVKNFSYPYDKIVVIEPGLDLPAFAKNPSHFDHLRTRQTSASVPMRLLCVGSVVARKDQLSLIKAVAGLPDVFENQKSWRLDIIGDLNFQPSYAQKMHEVVEELGLQNYVHLHGKVGEARLKSFYESADLFILPSHYEGYGMAFWEALSYGLPVIATYEGSVAAQLPREATLLFRAGNSQQLRQSIESLAATPSLLSAMSQAGHRECQKKPSWEKVTALMSHHLKLFVERLKP
ncbi:glycosyltransferase family 4 protein [Polycladidibacter stylochi]|uniref:glycosyltransferase family 4 protein n=1 Tax=Polycladidibacter stylochi TaxID=1807766 RepID=UPI0019D3A9EE|nr:glycosyltransferase family 4 protein [Pseudovibrio stylochi]